MPNGYEIRGIPDAMARDAWWFGADDGGSGGRANRTGSTPAVSPHRRLGAAIILIALADVLFWDQSLGASLAIHALAIFCLATGLKADRAIWRPFALVIAGALPVVDMVQPLSIAFLGASLLVAVVWARCPAIGRGALAGAVLWLARSIPLASLVALRDGLRAVWPGRAGTSDIGQTVRTILRNWGLPVGGTLVFATLLVEANPLMGRLLLPRLDVLPWAQRGLFWLGVGLMVWPILDPALQQGRPMVLTVPQRMPRFGLNAASVLRALVMFNLLIGLQTVMDTAIILGGADLPDGMSYASYARRGAFPLLGTALLAGAFALSARPFLDEHRAMRPLLFLWLAQNVALCAAALMRLDLYVDAYGLTYMRIHAMIWMALVATGLGLTGWQVWRRQSNGWLMARVASLGLATLYLCAFVNFAQVIAERNLSGIARVDLEYLCDLGPMAAAEIGATCPDLAVPSYKGWRDFSFRAWRVRVYLARAETAEPLQ